MAISAVVFDFFGVLEVGGAVNKDLLDYIAELKKTGIKMGIISNADKDWVSIMLSEEQKALFNEVIISYRVNMAKPDSAIYKTALNKLGVKARDSIFVDDIRLFCDGALSAGMHAICYVTFNQMKGELEAILAGSSTDN